MGITPYSYTFILGVPLTSWTQMMPVCAVGWAGRVPWMESIHAPGAPCSSPSLRKAKRGDFGEQIPPAAHPPHYIHVPGLNLKAWIQSGSPTPARIQAVDALSAFPSPRCAPAEQNNARCVLQRAPAGGFLSGLQHKYPRQPPDTHLPRLLPRQGEIKIHPLRSSAADGSN